MEEKPLSKETREIHKERIGEKEDFFERRFTFPNIPTTSNIADRWI